MYVNNYSFCKPCWVWIIEKGIRIECPYSWLWQIKCTLTTLIWKNHWECRYIFPTKSELPSGNPKLYGYSILIPFSIVWILMFSVIWSAKLAKDAKRSQVNDIIETGKQISNLGGADRYPVLVNKIIIITW